MDNKIRGKISILIFVLLLVFIMILVSNIVSAKHFDDEVRRLCLEKDQSIPNDINPRFTCESDLCIVCVDSKGRVVELNKCDEVPECSPIQDFRFVDIVPPLLNLFLPLEGTVYNDRRVKFHIETDEFVDLEIIDNTDFGSRIRRLCNNCVIFKDFLSFTDGLHNIIIRATDASGNFAIKEVSFFVDSSRPRIFKTEPRKGFANGNFLIEFREENPLAIKLFYGNTLSGFNVVDIESFSCSFFHRRNICLVSIDLTDFDGEFIDYWFSVKDISGLEDVSRIVRLGVDITPPIIMDLFYSVKSRRATITLEIDEPFFNFAEYLDRTESSPRWKRLCSRLSHGICTKSIILREKGLHDITIRAWDDAGNFAEENLLIEV